MNENFERRKNPKYDREYKRRVNKGLKAEVPLGVLASLIASAKKHCAVCKLQLDAVKDGEHPQCVNCKARKNIEYAEVAKMKCERRNKTAYDVRCDIRKRREAEEQAEGSYEGELHGEEAAKPVEEFRNSAVADALDNARPTRW